MQTLSNGYGTLTYNKFNKNLYRVTVFYVRTILKVKDLEDPPNLSSIVPSVYKQTAKKVSR